MILFGNSNEITDLVTSKICDETYLVENVSFSISENFFTFAMTRPPSLLEVSSALSTGTQWIKFDNTSKQRSKFWLSVRPGQPKNSPGNQKYRCGCPTDNHKFSCLSSETRPYVACSKSTDNQNLIRTTRNCNLIVRGTTIYFFLIRTLQEWCGSFVAELKKFCEMENETFSTK